MSKWYAIAVRTGQEDKISSRMQEELEKANLLSNVEEIILPVTEDASGKKVNTYKGYLFIKAELNNELVSCITKIKGVGGFVGVANKPSPVPQAEINKVLETINKAKKEVVSAQEFNIGDNVTIKNGSFASFVGTVKAIDHNKNRAKIEVLVFGRPTEVDVSLEDIKNG